MPPKRERKSKKTVVLESQTEAVVEPVVQLPDPAPAPAPAPVPAPVPVPVAETKKKGKKQPKIVAMVTPDGIQGTFHSEPRRPLIAHLQINPTNVQFMGSFPKYDPTIPTQPEPYEPGFDNYFTNMNETLPNQQAETVAEPATEPVDKETQQEGAASAQQFVEQVAGLPAFVNYELMVEYREPSSQRKIPAKTDIACYWCAHGFDTMPCILPEREEGGVYKVYGNFCCPECALAYLLEESLDATTRWERMALLHRIYGPALHYKRIFPAPSRSTLKLFGGPMTIQTYRKTIRDGKVRIDIQMPPMVSILGSLDTKPIDFYDSSLRNTFSPLLQETVPKAEENLRLKRSKPLKDRESTLDSVMNIQIKLKKVGGMGLTA